MVGDVVITDAELRALTPDQRTELISKLVDVDRLPSVTTQARAYRAIFLRLVLISTLLLIPWIVFLAVRLPRLYAAERWDLAWAGFDVALLFALGATAWGVWKRRQLVVAATIISGTLLLVDAWFDILTSHPGRDQSVAVASALLVELPLAILMFVTAHRLVSLTARTVNVLVGGTGDVGPLWRAPLIMAEARRLAGHRLDQSQPTEESSG